MIESVLTFTLHAVSNTGQGKIDVYQTVFLQGQTATATIAISGFTNGLENGQMGIAIAIITKAGVVTGPGKTETLPLDPRDVLCNQIRIPKCSFITFRMGLELAEAVAVASVFVEGAPLKMSTRSDAAWVVEKSSGRVSGFHRVSFPAGVKLPSDAVVSRRIRECAAVASGVDVRSLAAVRVSRPPRIIAAGLVVDPASGRVRQAKGQRGKESTRLASVLGNDSGNPPGDSLA